LNTFTSGFELISFLKSNAVSPFLIICDVNLPKTEGFEIKSQLANDRELKYKSVPFIFSSTSASEKQVQEAYDLPTQGFFQRPTFRGSLQHVKNYWVLGKESTSQNN